MVNKDLLEVINTQLDNKFPQTLSIQNLQGELSIFINDLIQNDFQRLISILYKVDIDEEKLKMILQQSAKKNSGNIIAELIIKRETQKIETRKQYQSKE